MERKTLSSKVDAKILAAVAREAKRTMPPKTVSQMAEELILEALRARGVKL